MLGVGDVAVAEVMMRGIAVGPVLAENHLEIGTAVLAAETG